MPDPLPPNRFELKFKINESLAKGIRQFLRGIVEKDRHVPGDSPHGYPVCSVYLDSPSAGLYRQTATGEKNRFKLRIRVYDDDPSHPAFVEIKRRENQVIRKQRASVDRESAERLLAGGPPEAVRPWSDQRWRGKERATLREFCRLRDQLAARGRTVVRYDRDAYVARRGSMSRVTFDRWLSARSYSSGQPVTIPGGFVETSDYNAVILEFKFTDRFPHWMADLVRTFDLTAVSFPKYIQCADSIGGSHRRAIRRLRTRSAMKRSLPA